MTYEEREKLVAQIGRELFTKRYTDAKKWLDIYFAYATSPENQRVLSPGDYQQVVNKRNYWRGQFGFDRADTPKGIVKIDCQSLSDYIKGGDTDAAN